MCLYIVENNNRGYIHIQTHTKLTFLLLLVIVVKFLYPFGYQMVSIFDDEVLHRTSCIMRIMKFMREVRRKMKNKFGNFRSLVWAGTRNYDPKFRNFNTVLLCKYILIPKSTHRNITTICRRNILCM